jgi:O-antigen/teichoic acid export membrane protein
MSIKNKLIKNTVISGASTFLLSVMNFLLIPFMIHRLGVIEYGLIGICQIFTLGGYLSLLDLGLHGSIVKYIAEYTVKKEQEKLLQLVNSTLIILLGVGLGVSILTLIGHQFILGLFSNIGVQYQESFSQALVLLFIAFIFQFPNIVMLGLFGGLQRFDILKGIQSSFSLLNTCGIIILLVLEQGFLEIIWLSVVLSFLQFIVYFIFAFWKVPGFKIRLRYFSWERLRSVATMSKYMFLGKIASLAFHHTDRILIGMAGPALMTAYDVLVKLPRLIKLILGLGNSAVVPAASEIFSSKNSPLVKSLFIRGLTFNYCFCLPIVTGAMYFSQQFWKIWLGEDYLYLSDIMQVMLIWNLMTPLVTFGSSILSGINRQLKHITSLAYISIGIKVLISIIFVKEFGLWAVVIGHVASIILTLPWYLSLFLKEFETSWNELFKILLAFVGIVIVPYSLLSGIQLFLPVENLMVLLALGGIWCLSYWIASYYLVLSQTDKKVVIDLLLAFHLRPASKIQSYN